MSSLFEYIYGGSSKYLLGSSLKTMQHVSLPDTNRCTYVVGLSGKGKSNLLANLILSDIEKGDRSVVVLDPHNELVETVALECPPDQAHRVTYFSPATQRKKVLGFNPFEVSSQDEEEYELKADAIMQVFAHTWNINYGNAPTMQNTLETFTRTLLSAYPEYKTSFLHMLCLIRKDDVGDYWRERLSVLARSNPALDLNWSEWLEEGRRKVDIESSRQKIKHNITSNVIWPVLCQPTSSDCFNFQNLLSNKGVLLVALGGLETEFVRLLGSFILTQLVVTARLQQKEESPPCNVYADEFYYFNHQSFKFIIDEGRKFRLYCTIAHQNLDQITNRVAATVQGCGNIIVFSVNPDDAGKLNKHFVTRRGTYIKPATIANLPDYEALIRYKRGRRRPQDWIRTFKDKRPENKEVAKMIWRQSVAYGRPMAEIQRIRASILQIESGPPQLLIQEESIEEKPSVRAKAKKLPKKKGFTA